ncbi:hypothetical protein FO519_009228 [Halicephalobus sp. NKZ332]|nr:hypothetical protein FO519_009228 [Halicephalobus sp. NKZ332]
MYIAVDLVKGCVISDDESKKFRIEPIAVKQSLFKAIQSSFIDIKNRISPFSDIKLILCCPDQVIQDEDYVIHVAAHIFKMNKQNITVIGTKAPIYDYWISQAKEGFERNDIYIVIRIEVEKGIVYCKAALFTIREELPVEDNDQYMVYFDTIDKIKAEHFPIHLQKVKNKYKGFDFTILCRKDDQVSQGYLTELWNISDLNMIKSDEYDRARGALLRFTRENYIPAEEYADLQYKPTCNYEYNYESRMSVTPVALNLESTEAPKFFVGIDLGTKRCAVAVLSLENFDQVDVITSPNSRIVINDHERFKVDREFNIEAVFDTKRLIGKSFEEITAMNQKWPFEIIRHRGRVKLKPLKSDMVYSPEEILSNLIGHLLNSAEEKYGILVKEAIITVPVLFDNKQRESIKTAAVLAGIHVPEVIEEPTSSFYEYQYRGKMIASGTIMLVLDLGGGTFDLALIENSDNSKRNNIITHGDPSLGGIEFDGVIMNIIEEIIPANYKEELKKAEVRANLITMTLNLKPIKVTRENFKIKAKPLIDRIMNNIKGVLQSAPDKEVTLVLLTGQGCKMPFFEEIVKECCKSTATISGLYDDTVAKGAARYGSLDLTFSSLSSRLQDDISQIVISCSDDDFKIKDRISVLAKKYFKTKEIKIIPQRTGVYAYWLYKKGRKFNPGDVVLIIRIKRDSKLKNRITYSAAAFTLHCECMVYFDYIPFIEDKVAFKKNINDKVREYNKIQLVYSYGEDADKEFAKEISASLQIQYLDTFKWSAHDRVQGGLIIGKIVRAITFLKNYQS